MTHEYFTEEKKKDRDRQDVSTFIKYLEEVKSNPEVSWFALKREGFPYYYNDGINDRFTNMVKIFLEGELAIAKLKFESI